MQFIRNEAWRTHCSWCYCFLCSSLINIPYKGFVTNCILLLPWVPEAFHTQFPVSVKSLFDLREKPLDRSAVHLMTPNQWQAGLNRLWSDFGRESWLASNDHLQIFESNRECHWLLKNAKNSTTAQQHRRRRETVIFQVCVNTINDGITGQRWG